MDEKVFYSSADALRAAGLGLHPEYQAVEALYPVKINGYCLKHIDPALGENDPFYRQFLPDMQELADEVCDHCTIKISIVQRELGRFAKSFENFSKRAGKSYKIVKIFAYPIAFSKRI